MEATVKHETADRLRDRIAGLKKFLADLETAKEQANAEPDKEPEISLSISGYTSYSDKTKSARLGADLGLEDLVRETASLVQTRVETALKETQAAYENLLQ